MLYEPKLPLKDLHLISPQTLSAGPMSAGTRRKPKETAWDTGKLEVCMRKFFLINLCLVYTAHFLLSSSSHFGEHILAANADDTYIPYTFGSILDRVVLSVEENRLQTSP